MAGRCSHGWRGGTAALALLCCAACTPGRGGEEDDAPQLGEQQAIGRAAEMLQSPAAAPPVALSRGPSAAASPTRP